MNLVVALSLALLCFFATGSAAQSPVASSSLRGLAPGSLVLLLPSEAPADYKAHLPLLDKQFSTQLGQAGFKVGRLSPEQFSELMALSLSAVGVEAGAAHSAVHPSVKMRALATMVKGICEEVGCKLVVQARLVNRRADLWRGYAAWDGVERRQSDMLDSVGPISMEGEANALSIELSALTQEGSPSFLTYGGVTVIFEAFNFAHKATQFRTDWSAEAIGAGMVIGMKAALSLLVPVTLPVR